MKKGGSSEFGPYRLLIVKELLLTDNEITLISDVSVINK